MNNILLAISCIRKTHIMYLVVFNIGTWTRTEYTATSIHPIKHV